MGTKAVKIADICIDSEVIDIEGEVNEEAWVFERHYDAEEEDLEYHKRVLDIVNRRY